MGHKDDTYLGWKIFLITGFIDHHWSSSYRIRKSDQKEIDGHTGHATGTTEEAALQNALSAAKQWIDNREGIVPAKAV